MATKIITYEKIIRANTAIKKLMKLKLPISKIRTTKQILKMAEAIQREYDFACVEERKIIEAYPEIEFNESGSPILKPDTELNGIPAVSAEKKSKGEAFMIEITALHESDAEWDFDVIEISEDDLANAGDVSLTAEDLEAFDGFIEFVEE